MHHKTPALLLTTLAICACGDRAYLPVTELTIDTLADGSVLVANPSHGLWDAKRAPRAERRDVIGSPLRWERQPDGRFRFWGEVRRAGEASPRVLRVVTLEDRETIHNAFFDRGLSRRSE